MAGFSYSDFVAFVKEDGLSKQNRFYIELAVRTSMTQYRYRPAETLCKGVSIPSVQIASQPLRITGEVLEAPYDRTFSGASFQFYCDRKLSVKMFFDIWFNKIQSTNSRIVGYYSDFISPEIKVHVLDKNNTVNHTIILYEAYPKSIGTLMVDHDSPTVMLLDVQFEYKYYDTEGVIGDTSTGAADTIISDGIASTSINSMNNKVWLLDALLGKEQPYTLMNDLTSQINSWVSGANDLIGTSAIDMFNTGTTAVNTLVEQTQTTLTTAPDAVTYEKINPVLGVFNQTVNEAVDRSIKYVQNNAGSIINTAVNATISGGALPDMSNIMAIAENGLEYAKSEAINIGTGMIFDATSTATYAIYEGPTGPDDETPYTEPPATVNKVNATMSATQATSNAILNTAVSTVYNTSVTALNKAIARIV